jgi:putative hemolysin
VKWVELKDSEKLLGKGLELSSYRVRLAQNDKDREDAYKIRFKIFNEELGEGIPENAAIQKDIDPFDPFCDHLLVEKEGLIVGTYRLLPPKKAQEAGMYYSESEFHIKKLPIDFKEAVETGRACVIPEHRKQSTLVSLFIGLRHYMNLMDCQYLFGLASLPKMSHENALATYVEIQKMGKCLRIPGVVPKEELRIPKDVQVGSTPQIPPLLMIYFQLGAFVCTEPAYDPIFTCHDLLTLCKLEEVPEKAWTFLEKFVKRSGKDET